MLMVFHTATTDMLFPRGIYANNREQKECRKIPLNRSINDL